VIDAHVLPGRITSVRDAELRRMLAERRVKRVCAPQRKIRRVPGDGAPGGGGGVIDAIERSDADIQEETGSSITRMKSGALHMDRRRTAAARRGHLRLLRGVRRRDLEQRLQALPFEARCQPCEHARERAARREMSRRRAEPLLELT
jgi:hypothetical protein